MALALFKEVRVCANLFYDHLLTVNDVQATLAEVLHTLTGYGVDGLVCDSVFNGDVVDGIYDRLTIEAIDLHFLQAGNTHIFVDVTLQPHLCTQFAGIVKEVQVSASAAIRKSYRDNLSNGIGTCDIGYEDIGGKNGLSFGSASAEDSGAG